MSLCIVGNQSLDDLEQFAIKHFSSVENKNLALKDYSQDPMFHDSAIGHILRYVPLKKSTMLSINWPHLSSTKGYWDGSPLIYLGHLIGDEGKGSLLSELIKQGLAVNLMAGAKNKLQDQRGGFYIDITLTDKGLIEENIWKVIRLFFAAVNQFQVEGTK